MQPRNAVFVKRADRSDAGTRFALMGDGIVVVMDRIGLRV
jgi:hypothetical protein